MRLLARGLRHPFYPALKLAPVARSSGRCAALAGTVPELSTAVVQVDCAVFPLRYPHSPFLEDAQREALWHRFRVPVFAILLDSRNRVIGYECEIQDGFHLAPDYAGGFLFGSLEPSPCDCGRPGPRLIRQETAILEAIAVAP